MNVIFKKLKMTNFLSVGKMPLEILFSKGIHFITGKNLDEMSDNGVGKTTIVSALFFALYGELDRKMLKGHIAHRENNETCVVELEFSVGENNYHIIRQLRPSKVDFLVNGEDMSRTNVPSNEDIIKVIGNTSLDLFKKTIVMSSNSDEPFLAMSKKADKIEFIEGILSLNYFTELLDKARKKANTTDKELIAENAKYSTLQSHLESNKKSFEEFEKNKITEIENLQKEKIQIQTTIDTLSQAIDINSEQLLEQKQILIDNIPSLRLELESKIDALQIQITLKDKEIENLEKDLQSALLLKNKELDNVDNEQEENVQDVIKKYDSHREKLKVIDEKEEKARIIEKKLFNEKAELDFKVKQIGEEIRKLKNTPTECPTCKQTLKNCDPKHLENSLKEKEEEKTSIEKGYPELDVKLKDFNEKYQKLKSIKADTNKAISEVDENIKQIKLSFQKKKIKIKDEINDIQINFSKQIQGCKNEILAVQTKMQGLRLDHKKEISTLEDEIKKIETEISSVAIKEKEINNWKQKYNGLDDKIIQIQERVNPFEKVIADSNTDIENSNKEVQRLKKQAKIWEHVKFLASPEGLKSYMIKKIIKLFNQRLDYYLKRLNSQYYCAFDEFFEETIFDKQGKEIGYSNLSGGEKKRLDVAMIFTFRDIRKHQTGISFNISMFDEIFDSAICAVGMGQIMGILRDQVDSQSEGIYIVTHRKSNCDYDGVKVINLVKENKCTRIVN